MPLTRRQALTTAGAAAMVATSPRALADSLTDNAPVVVGPGLEPEVVTVTDTAFAAWWQTDDPGDTTLVLETVDGPQAGARREVRVEENQTVHAARVTDLTPGTTYRYEMRTNGRRVNLGVSVEADPGQFTTLTVPSGRLLARIALINDMHVGEKISGQITSQPGVGSVPPSYTTDDYSFKMLDAGIGELRGQSVDLLVANGDLSDRGREVDVGRALAKLRELEVPLLVTRGNHDRRLEGACASDGDCLRAQAYPDQPAGEPTLRSVARVGDRVAVVGLDSADPDTGDGRLDLGDQPAWLDATLTTLGKEGRIVIVAFHHPIRPPDETSPPSFSDHVDAGRDAVFAVLAKHEHVRLAVHGHTHRNNLGSHPSIGDRLPFLENGAMKEYPAGYALLDVYEGGIMRTFHRPVTDFTRTWVRTSAMELDGFQPAVTRGSLLSRAFTTSFDGSIAGAGPAKPGGPTVKVRVARRRGLRRFLRDGLVVHVTLRGKRTPVTVAIAGRVGSPSRSRSLLLASARRRGGGRIHLRARRATRARLRKRRQSLHAVVTIVADGQTIRRSVTFLR